MIVSASEVMAFWFWYVAQDAQWSAGTFAYGPVDPDSLGPDQLPHLSILNPHTTVEMLEWGQRETSLAWDMWVVVKGDSSAEFITRIEAIETLSQAGASSTINGRVRWWMVNSWEVYKLDEDRQFAVISVETNRIEP